MCHATERRLNMEDIEFLGADNSLNPRSVNSNWNIDAIAIHWNADLMTNIVNSEWFCPPARLAPRYNGNPVTLSMPLMTKGLDDLLNSVRGEVVVVEHHAELQASTIQEVPGAIHSATLHRPACIAISHFGDLSGPASECPGSELSTKASHLLYREVGPGVRMGRRYESLTVSGPQFKWARSLSCQVLPWLTLRFLG